MGNKNWDDCPVWPEPNIEESNPLDEYKTKKIIHKITILDSGVYNITIEAKNNKNMTNKKSVIIRIYPSYEYFSLGIIVSSIILTSTFILLTFLERTNDISKQIGIYMICILSILPISFSIFYYVLSKSYDNPIDFFGFLIGFCYTLIILGLYSFLVTFITGNLALE